MDFSFEIRPICAEDNFALATVIKTTLTDLGLNKPGTAFGDEATNRVSEYFTEKYTKYWVLLVDGKLVGGAGINTLPEADESMCELQKMYLTKDCRGKNLGQQLMATCLEYAKSVGYKTVYIETMSEMLAAQKLYKRNGFEYLPERMGKTGHFDCDVFMIKQL